MVENKWIELRYAMGAGVKEKRFHIPLSMAVPQTCLRYAMGAGVKEKHFHTPLFMAVPQTCLRYAMGAKNEPIKLISENL